VVVPGVMTTTRRFAAVTVLALLVVSVIVVRIKAQAAPVPPTSCTVFPADNIWNTDISTLPVNTNSATWLASTLPTSGKLHPDFGGTPYGIPFNVVDNTHATANYTFTYANESDPGPYPAGSDLLVEQGSDAHVLTLNRNTCKLYETFATDPVGHTAGSGAIFDLASDQLRPAGWTSADAAGLPILPGLVRFDEVQAGFIGHAIRFTVHNTNNSYLWPARHSAGIADPSLPPMGARFRLKAGYDISAYGTEAKVVLTAFKKYGLIVADNGSDWFFQGTEDANWDSTIISDLKNVPASQFEAVDESSLMVDPSSAATVPTAPPAAPTAPVALAGEASATVSWTTPAGGAVTGYTVTASPGGATATAAGNATSATVLGLTDATSYTFVVTATNSVGTSPPSATSNSAIPGRGAYQALPPARILDTRAGTALGPGGSLNVQVTGHGGVPSAGVSAVVLNVTATNTTAAGYLMVWPAGVPRPLASNLNWVAGQTVPNLVEVALGTGGQVSVYNAAGSADVVFDVAGYVTTPTMTPPAAGLYNPVVPIRVLDTRAGFGAPKAQVCAGQVISVQITGTPTIPSSGVAAVVLNVTATNTVVAPSYVTVYPTGSARPLASNLNFLPGQTVPNRVVVKVGAGGSVDFYDAAGHTDIVADVAGWFTDGSTAAAGSLFVGVTPARILDTRSASKIGPGATRIVLVAGQGGVPPVNATVPPTAVVLNVTVTNPTAGSYLTVWPDGTIAPLASDLNYVAGQTVPNLVVVKLGADGSIDLFNAAGTTDVVVDIVGWYG
jgi:Fibronectin type III domain